MTSEDAPLDPADLWRRFHEVAEWDGSTSEMSLYYIARYARLAAHLVERARAEAALRESEDRARWMSAREGGASGV